MCVASFRAVRVITATLLSSDGHGNMTKVSDSAKRAARSLVRKFRVFAALVLVAVVALVANGALSASSGLSVYLSVEAGLDPTQCALKGVYMAACVAVVWLFPAPRATAASGSGNKSGSAAKDSKGNAKVGDADVNTVTSGTGTAPQHARGRAPPSALASSAPSFVDPHQLLVVSAVAGGADQVLD